VKSTFSKRTDCAAFEFPSTLRTFGFYVLNSNIHLPSLPPSLFVSAPIWSSYLRFWWPCKWTIWVWPRWLWNFWGYFSKFFVVLTLKRVAYIFCFTDFDFQSILLQDFSAGYCSSLFRVAHRHSSIVGVVDHDGLPSPVWSFWGMSNALYFMIFS
jgi:hypothetical protein